jgi:DsbC/DsbD-like thiol-disulfide interchange protein
MTGQHLQITRSPDHPIIRFQGAMTKKQKVNMKTFLALVFSFALTVVVAWAQTPGEVVKAKVTMASPAARPNSVVTAAVVVEVLPGYHINDHHPSLDYLIPTEVKLEPSKQVTVKDITYPKGELKKFAFSDALLSVYEGTIRVDVALQLERKALPGNYELKGQLGYQACNDHACLPPASAPLLFSFKVVRRGAPVGPSQ